MSSHALSRTPATVSCNGWKVIKLSDFCVSTPVQQQESFNTLKMWIKELRDKGPENIVICIAGNKKDLEAQRKIDTENAQASQLSCVICT